MNKVHEKKATRANGHAAPHADDGARRKTARRVLFAGGALVVACAIAVTALALEKRHARREEAATRSAEVDKGPVVRVAKAAAAPAERDVTLTGDLRALFQTSLYAKVSGYVRDVRVDKGDVVKKGQVLGEIESPETDDAVVAAQSDFALRKTLAARARRLAPAIVAVQDLETSNSNFDVSRANLARAQATQQYELIRAPFDGVITARYVDPGALMPAATSATQSALPFVDIADPATLRVDVYAGQDVAPFVHDGDPATIWQDIRPEQRVHAKVTRCAGALDPRTRTMLVEIQVDNRPYGFVPGTFANVTLHIKAPALPSVPSEALVSRQGKNLLARVEDGHLHFVEVDVGMSNGRDVQIERGIHAGDVVALNVPIEAVDGSPIQAIEKKDEEGAGPEKTDSHEEDGGGAPSRDE